MLWNLTIDITSRTPDCSPIENVPNHIDRRLKEDPFTLKSTYKSQNNFLGRLHKSLYKQLSRPARWQLMLTWNEPSIANKTTSRKGIRWSNNLYQICVVFSGSVPLFYFMIGAFVLLFIVLLQKCYTIDVWNVLNIHSYFTDKI